MLAANALLKYVMNRNVFRNLTKENTSVKREVTDINLILTYQKYYDRF